MSNQCAAAVDLPAQARCLSFARMTRCCFNEVGFRRETVSFFFPAVSFFSGYAQTAATTSTQNSNPSSNPNQRPAWLLHRGAAVLGKTVGTVRAHVRNFSCAGRPTRAHQCGAKVPNSAEIIAGGRDVNRTKRQNSSCFPCVPSHERGVDERSYVSKRGVFNFFASSGEPFGFDCGSLRFAGASTRCCSGIAACGKYQRPTSLVREMAHAPTSL